MKASQKNIRILFISFLLSILARGMVTADQGTTFECGGHVEAEVWNLWDTNIRDFLHEQLLQKRLLKQGDVYSLYDFQTYTHNMVSMARRCNRIDRLQQVANLVRIAYGALEKGTPSLPGRLWVCRGGTICNEKNGLLNREVMLDSVQFLGLCSSVANALAASRDPLKDEEKTFIKDTVQITTEHLLRWGHDAAIKALGQAAAATPQDVRNGSPDLFFTDKHLWMITIYAELAGILQHEDRQRLNLIKMDDKDKTRLHQHLNALLKFFLARVSFQRNANSRLGNVDLADLDRGYRRLYADNLYAGYEKDLKPVVCVRSENDRSKFKMEINVTADAVRNRHDTGWDFSHARRLVHALDALERNHNAINHIFSLKDEQLPAIDLPRAFANTLVAVVWNGDTTSPLFSNYWSGANGWFRVAYDIGIGQCFEGYPPYGMTDSFPTGGFITWARYQPVIGLLGQRLYYLMSTPDGESSPFIIKYYLRLSKSTNVQGNSLTTFMFLPSLVGVINK